MKSSFSERVNRYAAQTTDPRQCIRADGGKEAVLKTARTSLRSRLLRRFVGDQYAVLVLTPVGRHVDAVEIVESHDPGPDE